MAQKTALIISTFIVLLTGCATLEDNDQDELSAINDRVDAIESRVNELVTKINVLTGSEQRNVADIIGEREDLVLLWSSKLSEPCSGYQCSEFILYVNGTYEHADVFGLSEDGILTPTDLDNIRTVIRSADLETISALGPNEHCLLNPERTEYLFILHPRPKSEVDFSSCETDLSDRPEPFDTIQTVLAKYGYQINF
jgi:hypothetical protein